ncbi:MAG: class I SAM-dependent methyltransferase [Phycisphaerales bacterium]|nr:class I SAM-dependent methyltransferase [Phycisphaerales bacterium]
MENNSPAHRAALSTEDYHKLTGFDGDWRDTWWDDEFLSMMARQWGLNRVETVLDVGCGVGHWGQRLLRHMNRTTTLHGVDPEKAWVEGARKRAQKLGQEERSDFQIGTAENLPWPDNSLDMVTCQTLLIHVADIHRTIQEMTRVLKPGGLFLAAEPNNFGSTAAGFISNPMPPWEKIFDLLELEYRCTQGKAAVGEGHQSGGQLVMDGLRSCGWNDVKVKLNNQSARVTPPYTDLASKTMVEFLRTSHESGAAMVVGSTRENCLRYYLAGGGEKSRFPMLWDQARKRLTEMISAIDEGTYASAGGHIHYLTWGYKPAF